MPQEILRWALPLAIELDERPKRPLGRRGCAGRRPSHSAHRSKKYELRNGQNGIYWFYNAMRLAHAAILWIMLSAFAWLRRANHPTRRSSRTPSMSSLPSGMASTSVPLASFLLTIISWSWNSFNSVRKFISDEQMNSSEAF